MQQIYIGKKIAELRKEKNMTQEQLALKLGVTNQAVSKWESDLCYPDITLLPELSKALDISLDELFGIAAKTEKAQCVSLDDLPWEDDDELHAVCFVGHKLMNHAALGKNGEKHRIFSAGDTARKAAVTLEFSGTVDNIYSDFSVTVKDSEIKGSVKAGDGVTCGAVCGSVTAGDGVTCTEVGGSVTAGDGVRCGNVGGNVSAGDSVNCGSVGGSIVAEFVNRKC